MFKILVLAQNEQGELKQYVLLSDVASFLGVSPKVCEVYLQIHNIPTGWVLELELQVVDLNSLIELGKKH